MSAAEPEVIQPEKGSKKKASKALVKQEPAHLAQRPQGDVDTLLTEAVKTGNLEVLERVMAIRRELKAEAAREEFFAALSAFQSECPVIKKTKWVKSKTGTLLYSYAPLDQIVKQVNPLLTKHGLSYKVEASFVGGSDGIGDIRAVIKIFHCAGHHETSEFVVPIRAATEFTNIAQQFGSSNTYAKRYAFCNGFGIMTEDEDTDSRGISPREAREVRGPVNQPRETPTAQRAKQANGEPKTKVDLRPAAEGEETMDENTINGLERTMKNATLGESDFRKRFPQLESLSQVRKVDSRVVLLWINDPVNN